ncbi:hypothetical protein M0R45_000549 [Rubus argutus]|uniref:Uncharacterized protein n=1 Tax=Rubus argutus TaxID=59490 RepID=A0AAW1VPL7_RUBAR
MATCNSPIDHQISNPFQFTCKSPSTHHGFTAHHSSRRCKSRPLPRNSSPCSIFNHHRTKSVPFTQASIPVHPHNLTITFSISAVKTTLTTTSIQARATSLLTASLPPSHLRQLNNIQRTRAAQPPRRLLSEHRALALSRPSPLKSPTAAPFAA